MKEEWISVKDRLPEEDSGFLVFCPTLDRDPEKCIRVGTRITGHAGVRPSGCLGYDDDSTHWTPFPPPPPKIAVLSKNKGLPKTQQRKVTD